MKLDKKSDQEIESWARKYEERGLTDDPDYRRLLEERTRRRQAGQKLSFDKSMAHIKACAIDGSFTTYGQLADASGVEWNQARHQMNGPNGHLDTLLDICFREGLPLLTAICVNQQGLKSGKLGEEALRGFADGARRLGLPVKDAEQFHTETVEECFAWGKRQA